MKEPKIDAYIAKSADFAKPIMIHLRSLIHKACPNVEEKIKWGMPHFDYKDSLMIGIAGFKSHCTVTFHKATMMNDKYGLLEINGRTAMGNFGKITSVSQLPEEKFILYYIKEAMRLNEAGIKSPQKPKGDKKSLVIPKELIEAMKKQLRAREAFDRFSYSHQKEFIEWIVEAKRLETKISRVEKTIEMLLEGRSRNQKYKKK